MRRVLIGMLAFLVVIGLLAAGYRCGKSIAISQRATATEAPTHAAPQPSASTSVTLAH